MAFLLPQVTQRKVSEQPGKLGWDGGLTFVLSRGSPILIGMQRFTDRRDPVGNHAEKCITDLSGQRDEGIMEDALSLAENVSNCLLWGKTRKLQEEENVMIVCPLCSVMHNFYTVRIRKATSTD